MEQQARAFAAGHHLSTAPPTALAPLEALLTGEYGYQLDRSTLAGNPVAVAGRLRSVFRPQSRTLLLLASLTAGQQAFVIGRELAFNYLKLKERHYASPNILAPRSFEEVLNNFRASYFASALLMDEAALLADLRQVFAAATWQPAAWRALLARYAVSPELLMQRLAALLPRHFGLNSLFFLRFDQARATADYRLTKEIHLSHQHNPHGNELHEHYCRRWVSLRLLADGRQPPAGDTSAQADTEPRIVLAAQRSHYFGTNDEYLCLSLARVSADPAAPVMSVTIGLRVDEQLHQQIAFGADPAVPRRVVNETCERCPIADCRERAAPPTQAERAARRAALEAAIEELVAG